MKLEFIEGRPDNFNEIRKFYHKLIEEMSDESNKIGWRKGIYPCDIFLRESLELGQLYKSIIDSRMCGCVILNNESNSGYVGVPWKVKCPATDVLIPHALAVRYDMQGQGIGKKIVDEILKLAKNQNKLTVRLDILGVNSAAEKLYTKCGFQFVQAKTMYYADTGWTEYKLFEYLL